MPKSTALVATWRPHGELPRLLRLLPQIESLYTHIVIGLIDYGPDVYDVLRDLPNLRLVLPPDGAHGRMAALETAATTDAEILHYCDLDRLLRWIETRPAELEQALAAMTQTDCLILGRTPAAYATHPLAMQTTERIINEVSSHLLGLEVEICAGAKGISRPLLRFLLSHAPAEGWGDLTWAVLARRGGFRLATFAADGLDYETADRHRLSAADSAAQRSLAAQIDADISAWQQRVRVAQEILAEGLAAQNQSLDMS